MISAVRIFLHWFIQCIRKKQMYDACRNKTCYHFKPKPKVVRDVLCLCWCETIITILLQANLLKQIIGKMQLKHYFNSLSINSVCITVNTMSYTIRAELYT